MSFIVLGQHRESRNRGHLVELPLEAGTYTHGILAMRGAGKSNAGVVMAEGFYNVGMPWVAIDPKGDWWGIRSAGDGSSEGLPIPIFGGIHGDIPLEASAGRLMADLIIESQMTCVLDTSEFSKTEQTRFLADFAERLFRGKARNPFPLHVFCEEADDYIPQRVYRDQARTVGAFSKLVKQGRSRGLGITLITQRSAVLNKDVLTQLDTLIVLRTTAPQDRKAILSWVEHHAIGKELVDSLPQLENGEAWIWSPFAYKIMEQFTFNRRTTFDSGATPTMGKRKQKPTTLADVDMAAIKEQMTETIERAKADDPKELRKQIKELERQLAQRPTEKKIEYVDQEVPILTVEEEKLLRTNQEQLEQIAGWVDEMQHDLAKITQGITERLGATPAPKSVAPAPERKRRAAPAQQAAVTAPQTSEGDVTLNAGARRMLGVLASWRGHALTRAQVGAMAKVKHTGGTFAKYLSVMRTAGYITVEGDMLQVTDAGVEAAGVDIPPMPTTEQELMDQWADVLPAGARAMLDAVVSGRASTRERLGEITGITPSGGTFAKYLSMLRTAKLIYVEGQTVGVGEAFELVS